MIGEIRDLETARIAIQAGADRASGVLHPAHQQRGSRAITRLIDIGLERYLLASTIAGVMAQRLVRKLVSVLFAAVRGVPSGTASARTGCTIGARADRRLPNRRVAVGCTACGNVGYLGRTTISELLIIDDELRHVVGRRSDDQRIDGAAGAERRLPLAYEDGLLKVEGRRDLARGSPARHTRGLRSSTLANFNTKPTTGGTVSSGTIAADDVNAAIDALYGAGLTPFETQRSRRRRRGNVPGCIRRLQAEEIDLAA